MSNPGYPPRRFMLEAIVGIFGGGLLWFAWQADAQWFERHVLLFSFVVSPLGQWFCRCGRFIAIGLALLLLLFVRPRAGRWVASCSLGEALGKGAGIGIAVILALAVSEGALRHLQHRLTVHRRAELQLPSAAPGSRLCDLDARYGYVFHASQQTLQSAGGRQVPLSINAHHNRASAITSEPDKAQPTILFAGESITVGSGLRYEETFPALVGRRLGLQEVNLAVLGYGSDQAYLRVVDALREFSQPVAVVTLLLPGMLSRNFVRWRAHLDVDEQGALFVRPPSTQLELWRLFSEKIPFWTDGAIERSIALTRAIFVDTAKQARARGAVPLFVIPLRGAKVPREQRADWWIVRDIFEPDHLPYLLVDLDDHAEIPGDGHPNPHGAEQLADAVTAALRVRLRDVGTRVKLPIATPSDGDEQSAFMR